MTASSRPGACRCIPIPIADPRPSTSLHRSDTRRLCGPACLPSGPVSISIHSGSPSLVDTQQHGCSLGSPLSPVASAAKPTATHEREEITVGPGGSAGASRVPLKRDRTLLVDADEAERGRRKKGEKSDVLLPCSAPQKESGISMAVRPAWVIVTVDLAIHCTSVV